MTFQFDGPAYVDDNSCPVQTAFESNNIRVTNSQDEARLFWLWSGYSKKYGKLSNCQALNHIPLENAMTDKAHLTRHLSQYAQKHPEYRPRYADFYPESYCLHRPVDCEAFFSRVSETGKGKDVWILKHAHLSMGRGIRVIGDQHQLKLFSLHPQLNRRVGKGQFRHVIQKYIQNPLLLDHRKSEIRIFWLISCLDPLKVFVFPEGTVRLAAQSFVMGDFDNKFVHVYTGDQEKEHPEVEEVVLKWSFADLEKYLRCNYEDVKPGYLAETMMPKIGEILAYVVRSCSHMLTKTRGEGFYFGLYGADFILDQSLKPWLTEVQLGPDYGFNDEIKARVIPRLVNETAQIVMETVNRKLAGESVDELYSQKEFVTVNVWP